MPLSFINKALRLSLRLQKIVSSYLFAIILIIITLIYCLISLHTSLHLNKGFSLVSSRVSFIVKGVQNSTFGKRYLAYIPNLKSNFWLNSSKYSLQLGAEYIAHLDFEYYSNPEFKNTWYKFKALNSFQRYYLSQNILGQVKLSSADEPELVKCNFNCKLLGQRHEILINTQNKYKNLFCFNVGPKIISTLNKQLDCNNLAALSVGLVLGGTQGFSDVAKQNIQNLGLTHLVAVSGFQVVLITQNIERILGKIKLSKSIKLLLQIFFLGVFIFLVGAQPPIVRATLSWLIATGVSLLFGLPSRPGLNLLYSALISLLLFPNWLISASFQLSFVATASLFFVPKTISQRQSLHLNKVKALFKNIFAEVKEAFLSSFFSYIFTLPIIISLTQNSSVYSLLSNTLFIPIVSYLTYFNLMVLIPVIGQLLEPILIFIQSFVFSLINDIAEISSLTNFTTMPAWQICIYYLLLVFLIKNIPNLAFKYKPNKKTKQT